MADRVVVVRETEVIPVVVNRGPAGPEGEQGPQGLQGETGLQGIQGEPGTPGAAGSQGEQGEPGLSAYEVAVTEGFVGTEAEWLDSLVGATGPEGPQGPQGDAGSAGPAGAAGAPGSVWREGTGAPASGLGIDGDFYLDDATGDVYQKAAGSYSVVANIMGPEGPQGPEGDAGAPGAAGAEGDPGSVWRTVTGAPSNGLGVDGDFALDAASGDYYERVAGAYVLRGNLTGPAGEQGETGATGAPGQDGIASGTYLLSGATIAWVSGFTYRVGAATYYIDGTQVTSAEQEVALSAADATFDRFDVLVLDGAGALDVIEGTPAANPAEPSVDPSLYLRLGVVLVPAAAAAADVTETVIWEENAGAEWDATPSGASIVVASTNVPRTGTASIEGTNVAAGASVTFEKDSGTVDLATQDKLVFYIQVKAAWANKKAMRLQWLAAGIPVGAPVTVGNGLFGFNSQLTGSYQQLVVPLGAFSVPAGAAVDGLRLEIVGSGASVGFYLDDLVLQAGLSTVAAAPFRWRGAWGAVAAYQQNDAVSRSGATYLALQANVGMDPATETAFWVALGRTDLSAGAYDPGNTEAPATSPHSMDDAFDDSAGMSGADNGLDAKWTWINQGGATLSFRDKGVLMTCPTSGSFIHRMFMQALPAGDGAYRALLSVRCPTLYATNSTRGGLYVRDSATGKGITLWLSPNGSDWNLVCDRWDTDTSYNSTPLSLGAGRVRPTELIWLEIERVGANLHFRLSYDGDGFAPVGVVAESALGATMGQIGFTMMCESAIGTMLIRDFRKAS